MRAALALKPVEKAMPTDLTNDIMDLVANKAANRPKAKQFKSFAGRKAKKALKPKNIAKDVVTGLGGPFPFQA